MNIVTSSLGFGTSGLMRVPGRRARENVLAAARSCGITHFDTAPIYGLGESEHALGRFLRGARANVTIATKFGLTVPIAAAYLAPAQRIARRAFEMMPALKRSAVRGARRMQHRPVFTVEAVRRSLESSLRALRTDHVDLFLAHEASAEYYPGDELIDVLERLKRDGKIRAFGLASSCERTRAILPLCPALGNVLQFESDAFNQNVRGMPDAADRLLITHGALTRALALARARLGWRDDALSAALIRSAVRANPRGLVLMQSGSAPRIAHNVRAALSSACDEAADRLESSLAAAA